MVANDVFSEDQLTPVDLKISREAQRLTVIWADGHVSEFDSPTLRRNCPCAVCAARRGREEKGTELFTILQTDPGGEAPRVVGAELMGNYAIRLQWSDGHDAGIFEFGYLRSLEGK